MIVSPDAGGVERARAFAKRLRARLAIIDKRREGPNQTQIMNIIGECGREEYVVARRHDRHGRHDRSRRASVRRQGRKGSVDRLHTRRISGPALDRLQSLASRRS